jgi:hypothetical protein
LGKGVLPWVLEDNFNMLVQRLEEGNWSLAAQLAGVVSHYIADASMPLHATSDYNPGGNHGAFETEVNNRLSEISIPKDNYVPTEIENVFAAAMAMLEESYSYTGYQPDKVSYWLQQGVLWNSTLRGITENRLRSAVQLTANVWYTAMIRAGLTIPAPTPLEPEDNASILSATPTLTWTAVSGASTYDLQLAKDNSFSSNVITVKGRSSTSYTVETSLGYGTWYWRVRSGDNSTNVGLWSQVRQFHVNAGKVQFSPASLYKVNLNIDVYLEQGSRLVVKFYTYDDIFQAESMVWSGTTPTRVTLLEDVTHPENGPVEKAALVLTDDENNALWIMTSFIMRRSHIAARVAEIRLGWQGGASVERTAWASEVAEIRLRWRGTPA